MFHAQPRLILNSIFLLKHLNDGIIGMHHQAWLGLKVFNILSKLDFFVVLTLNIPFLQEVFLTHICREMKGLITTKVKTQILCEL